VFVALVVGVAGGTWLSQPAAWADLALGGLVGAVVAGGGVVVLVLVGAGLPARLRAGKRSSPEDLPGLGTPRPRKQAVAGTAIVARPGPAAYSRPAALARHVRAVCGLSIAPDGKAVVTCGEEDVLVCHDLVGGVVLWKSEGLGHRGGPAAFSPNGELVAVAGVHLPFGDSAFLRADLHVLDARTGQSLRQLRLPGQVHSLAWLPDSRHLLAGACGEVRAIDMNEPAEITTFAVDGAFGVEEALSLGAAPTGAMLFVGTHYSANVRVLSLPIGEELFALEGHATWLNIFRRNAVRAVAVSPNGQLALSGSNDGTARVWSVRSGEEICRFEGHADWWGFRAVTGVAWLPDGERALSSCEGGFLCLWDARTGAELKRWDHRRGIRCLALSPDGKVAVTGAWEGTVRVWYLD
jgi:WD40 repeat protein